MHRRPVWVLLSFLLLSQLLACAPAQIKKVEDQGGEPVSFPELTARPQAYEGRLVVLGGYVLETANTPEGSLLTVLQAPLDSQRRPGEKDESQGRFLARTPRFLDPEVYGKDRLVTVGGKVAGVCPQKVDGTVYQYPLIESQEIYLWSKDELLPYPYWYPWYPWFYPWPGPSYRCYRR